MKKILASVALSASLVSGAFAAANSNTGCGLGSMLIDKQGLIWNLFQITTNDSTGTQTFGITSGTSGCKSGKIVMDSRTQEFVAANMDALSQEIAQSFKVALQENYHKLYTSKDAQSADVLDGVASL